MGLPAAASGQSVASAEPSRTSFRGLRLVCPAATLCLSDYTQSASLDRILIGSNSQKGKSRWNNKCRGAAVCVGVCVCCRCCCCCCCCCRRMVAVVCFGTPPTPNQSDGPRQKRRPVLRRRVPAARRGGAGAASRRRGAAAAAADAAAGPAQSALLAARKIFLDSGKKKKQTKPNKNDRPMIDCIWNEVECFVFIVVAKMAQSL